MIYHGLQEFQKKINLAKEMISKDNINWTELDNGYKMNVEQGAPFV